MTEAREYGIQLVRVRAQVMTRDDSTGGWVPMEGGGLSTVSVRKREVPCEPGECKHEYLIFGKRISDQSIVLYCTIKKDFEYNKVMPTFHHWKTGEKKFGLTFQTAADARAFDKGLRTAVDELLEGLAEPLVIERSTSEVGDDDVFMTLNLPAEVGESRSSSDSSIRSMPPQEQPQQIRHLVGTGRLESEPESPPIHLEGYPFIQLRTVPEYVCPPVDETIPNPPEAGESPKKRSSEATPSEVLTAAPSTESKHGRREARKVGRQRCRYCHELYLEEENKRGACEYAPDRVRNAVNSVSCIRCASCMLYHCMADAEGDFAQHPCECNRDEGCGRRWLGLALLSTLVPCLWLYPPLKACHWCGERCGLCGGRHRPAS